jgi:soluble lytic murein transglycosylase-like protein
MYPAIRRSRAQDSCILAIVMAVSGCASTGPGTVPDTPGPVSETMQDSPGPPVRRASPPSFHRKAPEAVSPGVRPKAPDSESSSAPSRSAPRSVPRRVPRAVPRTRADSAALELAITKRLAQRPLAQALTQRIRNPELADRVASAVVYEAGRNRMSPSLLAAVLLIENAPLDSTAVSSQGAVGMMQVMPVHIGSYGCLSGDLLNVEANICHGARLLHAYLRRHGSVEVALRRYNGCVQGRNTPRCYRYPVRVLRTASHLRHDVLVSAAKFPDPSVNEETGEEQTVATTLGADLPRSVETTDTTAKAEETAACATLLGCLRHRWTKTR